MPSAFSRILLTAAVLAAGAGNAFAADPETTDLRGNVKDRPRPSYDAIGVHAGAFTIFPRATISESYDDNIYATDSNTTDDFITTLGASVAVNSNWSRHALNLTAGVSKDIYADNTGENRLDWNILAGGALDITRDTRLSGDLGYSQLHEDRGDPNAPGINAATEPTEYKLFEGHAALDQRFNRLTARLSGGYSDYDYDDVPAVLGGTIDQDDRDHTVYEEALRVGYDVSPDTSVYVQGTINQRDYDLEPPAAAVNRDSDGYAAVVGSDFRLSNLAQGEVYIGYQSQSYDSPLFSDIDGLSYGADVEWYATPLTTVTFSAASTVEETTTVGASGYLSQTGGVRIDHELMRNLLINARASYTNNDYEGVTRTDDILGAGLGLDYLVNRNFTLGLNYTYTDRDSDAAADSYTRNLIGLSLTGKL